jgi:hypothetical protein
MRRATQALAALAMMILVPACNREEARRNAAQREVEPQSTTASATTAVGRSAPQEPITAKGEGVTAQRSPKGHLMPPKGFPKDVLVYPKGSIENSTRQEENVYIILSYTVDPVQRVADAYRIWMRQQGWKEESTTQSGAENMVLNFEKNGRTVMTGIQRSGERTSISVTVDESNAGAGAPKPKSAQPAQPPTAPAIVQPEQPTTAPASAPPQPPTSATTPTQP